MEGLPSGRCSDPELEELLNAQNSGLPLKKWRWVFLAVGAMRDCGIEHLPEVGDKANLSR